MSTVFTFDYATFIVSYPAFAAVPQATLQAYWNAAICYVDPTDYGWLNGPSRYLALNLMTAHLAAIAALIAAGQVPGLVQNATVDKVTVGLTPPPLKNQWQWWLSLTPYGQQLFALLQANSVCGFYIGSLPERSAFRSVGGIFPGSCQ